MALINHETKEVTFKIVYCGTPLGGKTTNLTHIHTKVDEQQRGDLVSLATSTDRTLFFDFLPVHATEISGYQTRFQLYTVPGQVHYNATRQLVLHRADGLVFVADSTPDRLEANYHSFHAMIQNVRNNGADPARLPITLQYNKRDTPGATPTSELERYLNNGAVGGTRLPAFEAIATGGQNVLATLNSVTQEVLRRFHGNATASQQPATTPQQQALAS